MKKTLLIAASLLATTLGLYAQKKINESSVPGVVKAAFKKLYPAAKVENWTMDEGNYAAEFDHQNKETILLISPDGKTVKSETRIHPSELPREVRSYIATHYPGKKISDAVTSTDGAGNRIYEAEVSETDLIFDANGKFIKAVKERPVD